MTGLTPKQRERLDDMFKDADRFIAFYRSRENRSKCWCGDD